MPINPNDYVSLENARELAKAKIDFSKSEKIWSKHDGGDPYVTHPRDWGLHSRHGSWWKKPPGVLHKEYKNLQVLFAPSLSELLDRLGGDYCTCALFGRPDLFSCFPAYIEWPREYNPINNTIGNTRANAAAEMLLKLEGK